MRSRSSVRNFIVSISFQVFMMVCGLLFPRWIILTYGSVVNGLTQTVNQVINYLYLLQAGAVGASVFALYKPVAEEDYDSINSLLGETQRYFRKIGLIFVSLVCLIAPVIAALKTAEGLGFWEIICAILILGCNASFTFFVYAWYDTLFQSYQQQYLFTCGQFVERIVYYILLTAALLGRLPFLYMYLALLVGGIGRGVFLYVAYRKKHGQKIIRRYKGKTATIQNKGYLFINQIAIQAIEGAPVLILSFAFSLKHASIYSLYYMVYGILKSIISTIFASCNTAFANFSVSRSEKETQNLFDFMHCGFTMFGALLCFCCGSLFVKFIDLYTRGISDASYHQPLWAAAGLLCIAAYTLYIPYYMLTNIYGLFKDMAKPAVISSASVLVAAALLGKTVHTTFIVAAPAIYYLIMGCVRFVVAKKALAWPADIPLLRRGLFLVCALGVSAWLSGVVNRLVTDWIGWLGAAVIIGLLGLVAVLVFMLIVEKKSFIYAKGYVSAILGKRNKK